MTDLRQDLDIEIGESLAERIGPGRWEDRIRTGPSTQVGTVIAGNRGALPSIMAIRCSRAPR